jgi:hypothetical protein
MKIVEKKEINVEAYYTRCGPMVLRRCRRLLQDHEKAFLDANRLTKYIIKSEKGDLL